MPPGYTNGVKGDNYVQLNAYLMAGLPYYANDLEDDQVGIILNIEVRSIEVRVIFYTKNLNVRLKTLFGSKIVQYEVMT